MARLISICTAPGTASRWRAGYQFTPEAVQIPEDMLGEDALARIEADPYLIVGEVEVGEIAPVEPPAPAPEPGPVPEPAPVSEPEPETEKPAGRKAKPA